MTNGITQKRWFTDGAALAFAGRGRTVYWLINLALYGLLNMFVLRIQTGTWLLSLTEPYHSEALIEGLLAPLNIFQFPIYIIITALLMSLIVIVPILTAQLYNLFYALPYVAGVVFLGHNPVLGLSLFAGCAMASFEPLRLKSKFVAAVLCLLPILLYWGLFSGENPEQDVRRWAVLYAPWGLAFLVCVVILGVVLTIGHFLRYRPGVLMPIFGVLLAGVVLLFDWSIGMNERDFQAQVCQHSPERIEEFRSRGIRDLLEQELAERSRAEPYLNHDLILLKVRTDWLWAFSSSSIAMPSSTAGINGSNPVSHARREALEVDWAKVNALDHIEQFVTSHPQDKRVADALFTQALLIDLKVDLRALRNEDVIRFYDDSPSRYSENIWERIVEEFGDSDVSIEARWRLARLLAGEKPREATEGFNFDKAMALLAEAQQRGDELWRRRQVSAGKSSFWISRFKTLFTPPPAKLSDERLASLRRQIEKLMILIDKENRTGHLRHEARLAEFVSLDRHRLNYEERLKTLRLNSPQPDPLVDNIELASALLETDTGGKIALLRELAGRYPNRDGGMEAMLELAVILLEQHHVGERGAGLDDLLRESRGQLETIITLRPGTFFARYAAVLLESNPVE